MQITYAEEQAAIKTAIANFPPQFRLRAYAGIFHIDTRATHMRDDGVHLVVANEKNEQLCNGTAAELQQEILNP